MRLDDAEDGALLDCLLLCDRMPGWTLDYVQGMDDLTFARVRALLRGLDEGLAALRDPKYRPQLG